MTDTDRLAALLREARAVQDADEIGSYGGWRRTIQEEAAYLIAAGVTLDPRPAPDTALDVERLAEAIDVVTDIGLAPAHSYAQAISREYAALENTP